MSDGQRRIALVTGASYGVGAATAEALARDGYDLALTATSRDNLRQVVAVVEAFGASVLPLALDLRDQDSIIQCFAAARERFGGIDVLINNAATNLRRLAVDVTCADWDAVMGTNLTGTFFLTQHFGRHWIEARRPASIVNIASTHGLVGAGERSTYGISKAGLIQMTRMLAIEWAPNGIRVNAVAPGRMETSSPSRAGKANDPGYMQAMLSRIPLGRLATVNEVAAAVCYLASPAARSITGQTLVLDGGLTAA